MHLNYVYVCVNYMLQFIYSEVQRGQISGNILQQKLIYTNVLHSSKQHTASYVIIQLISIIFIPLLH